MSMFHVYVSVCVCVCVCECLSVWLCASLIRFCLFSLTKSQVRFFLYTLCTSTMLEVLQYCNRCTQLFISLSLSLSLDYY